jgi:hypothetical protein
MGALVMVALIAICTVNYTRNPDLIPPPAGLERGSTSSSFPGDAMRAKPELEPDRKVQEVDCSKPVDLSAGNLRCK